MFRRFWFGAAAHENRRLSQYQYLPCQQEKRIMIASKAAWGYFRRVIPHQGAAMRIFFTALTCQLRAKPL